MSADVLVADTRPISYEKFMDGFKVEQIAASFPATLCRTECCIECCERPHTWRLRCSEGSDGQERNYTFGN